MISKPTHYRAPYNIQEQNLDGKSDTKFMHYKVANANRLVPCSISSSRRDASSLPFIALATAFLSARNLSTSCRPPNQIDNPVTTKPAE